MPVYVWIVAAIALAAGIAAVQWALVRWKFRGYGVVTCPENLRPAGVRLHAGHAALSVPGKRPELHLAECSRWPEKAGCGQECLSQIAGAPENCLVRNILASWYAGKNCAVCGKPIGEIVTGGSHPALLLADKKSVEWSAIRAEQLPGTLQTAKPICFACHMANTLVRDHPELVVDRQRPVGPVRS